MIKESLKWRISTFFFCFEKYLFLVFDMTFYQFNTTLIYYCLQI